MRDLICVYLPIRARSHDSVTLPSTRRGPNPSNCSVSVCSFLPSADVIKFPACQPRNSHWEGSHLQGRGKKKKTHTTGRACPDLKTTSCRDVDSSSRAAALPGSLQHSSHSVVTSEEEWTGNSFHQMHFNCRPTGCHSQTLESKCLGE